MFRETIRPAPFKRAADTRPLTFYKILRNVVNRQIRSKVVANSFKFIMLAILSGTALAALQIFVRQLARRVLDHQRNAIPDRKGQAGCCADQLSCRRIVNQCRLRQRTNQQFESFGSTAFAGCPASDPSAAIFNAPQPGPITAASCRCYRSSPDRFRQARREPRRAIANPSASSKSLLFFGTIRAHHRQALIRNSFEARWIVAQSVFRRLASR